MPYPAAHMLLSWNGLFTLGAGQPVIDQFNGSLRFMGPGVDASDTQEKCNAMSAALQDWWKTYQNFIPGIAKLATIKWNKIGTDGHYVSKTRTQMDQLLTLAEGPQVSRYPLQVNLVATYLTANERGIGSRGRTFFPTTIPISSSNQMRASGSDCTQMASAVAGLIVNLNAVASSGNGQLQACVGSDQRGGALAPILSVRVGNRLDIQRRRDNALEESYSTIAAAVEQPLKPLPLIPGVS